MRQGNSRKSCRIGLGLAAALLGGCVSESGPEAGEEPVGAQLVRAEPQLARQRFLVTLNFESSSDGVFVSSEPSRGRIDTGQAHSGHGALLLPVGTRRVAVRIALLTGGAPLSGEWPLLGAYVYARQGESVVVSYEVGGREVVRREMPGQPAHRWVPLMLALAGARGADRTVPAGNLVITFAEPTKAPVWLDDVMLIDNRRTLVGGEKNWTLRQEGYQIELKQPGRFERTFATPEASPDGWSIEEGNEWRVRLASRGRKGVLTVYSDGRAYENGRFAPVMELGADAAALAAEHESPAEVEVSEDFGRVDRTTKGDANNDGYNEQWGAYELVAAGARFEVTIKPRTSWLVRPVLEITKLPEGEALVTMEGQLVEKVMRTEEGHLLIELPGRIDRAVTVNVRVSGKSG